jgi:hypothetical protein
VGLDTRSQTFTGPPGSSERPALSPEELRARQRELDRPVALKVLHPDLGEGASFAERFGREARTLARLAHPHIVSVYDFGHDGDLYYLVMELVDGVNLRQAIEAGGMEPKQALAIVPRICEALQFAHDQGVVHRDIKPENVLLDRQGAVKIADFGLAKLVGAPVSEPRLTAAEQVLGTPHYMAPEQIENPKDVDHRADIYALGVVLYELLTGELPLGRFPSPSKKVRVDVRLDDVVLRTLEKEPDLRYQRASDLQIDVESLSRPGAPAAAVLAGLAGEAAYEYRSARTLWGWPLLHVVFSGGAGRTRIARGVVAVGEVAIGAFAVGTFAFGGLTLGGISAGLLGIGGIAFGLIALGGIATGGFAVGGIPSGVVAIGERASSLLVLTQPELDVFARVVWLLASAAVVGAVVACVVALKGGPQAPRGSSRPLAGPGRSGS